MTTGRRRRRRTRTRAQGLGRFSCPGYAVTFSHCLRRFPALFSRKTMGQSRAGPTTIGGGKNSSFFFAYSFSLPSLLLGCFPDSRKVTAAKSRSIHVIRCYEIHADQTYTQAQRWEQAVLHSDELY